MSELQRWAGGLEAARRVLLVRFLYSKLKAELYRWQRNEAGRAYGSVSFQSPQLTDTTGHEQNAHDVASGRVGFDQEAVEPSARSAAFVS